MNILTITNNPENDKFELDGDTLAAIIAASDRPHQFNILMTTPKGNTVSILAGATYDSEAGKIRLEIPGYDPNAPTGPALKDSNGQEVERQPA